MKILITYKTKTGFTKQYAEWIQEKLQCDIMNDKHLNQTIYNSYDLVIYGASVHAGKVDGWKKIKKLSQNNHSGKLILFVTGATPAAATQQIASIWDDNFTEEERSWIPHFYMQSGLNYEKMGLFDRLIMKKLAKILQKKENKNSEEAGCQQAITHSYNISSKDYIQPLIDCIDNI